MLRDFLAWWLQQMAAFLPRSLAGGQTWRDAVIVRPHAAGLMASLRRRGIERPLGLLEPGGSLLRRLRTRRPRPVVIGLPAAALLQQSASLPLAAERDLQAVLGHEMDRLTPFNAADLYWTWRVENRDRAAGRLLLRLLLVPKTAVSATLDTLRRAGLRPVAIEVPAGAGVEHLPLQPPATRRRSTRILAWACAAAIVAVIAIPVIQQERAIMRAEGRVDALRPRIAVIDALRRRIAATEGSANLFTAESARVGSPLRALAALTAALPDDTFLTSFAMRERKLTFSGQSAAAARLIGALSADPELRDPAFDAPVTRTGAGADQFSIRAMLAP